MGDKCCHSNMCSLTQTDLDVILNALENYFKPARNVIYEKYTLRCCNQETDKPADVFLIRPRETASRCEYQWLEDKPKQACAGRCMRTQDGTCCVNKTWCHQWRLKSISVCLENVELILMIDCF